MNEFLTERLAKLRNDLTSLHDTPKRQQILELEQEARHLMQDAIGSDLVDEASDLLLEIISFRREYASKTETAAELDVEDALHEVEVTILAGSISDMRESVRILDRILQQHPENTEAYQLLARIMKESSAPQDMVVEVLSGVQSEQAQRLLAGLGHSELGSPKEQIRRLQNYMLDVFHAGEYKETLKTCAAILDLDPNNSQAIEYREKAEDFIERGVVPDSKLPLDARTAFGRGVSAMRAGIYEQAQSYFESAIEIAKEEGGIENWGDAKRALVQIDRWITAKNFIEEGDKKFSEGLWVEALSQYELSLKSREDPYTQKEVKDSSERERALHDPKDPYNTHRKYELITKLLRFEHELEEELRVLQVGLVKQAEYLGNNHQLLLESRNYLPASSKLNALIEKVQSRIAKVSTELQRQIEDVYHQVPSAHTLDERIRLLRQIRVYLSAMEGITTVDEEIQYNVKRLWEQAFSALSRFRQATQWLAPPIEEGDLGAIRLFLNTFSYYILDSRYQRILSNYIYECLNYCEIAQVDAQWETADEWLQKAESIHDTVFCAINIVVTNDEHEIINDVREMLEKEIQSQKNRFLFKRGKALASSKQYERAIELFEEILVVEPENELFELQCSKARKRQKENRELWSFIARGQAAYEAGDADAAVAALKEALKLSPNDLQLVDQYRLALELQNGWKSWSLRLKLKIFFMVGVVMVLLVLLGASLYIISQRFSS
jgi:tetratricopeptide (TPR) repeat protein